MKSQVVNGTTVLRGSVADVLKIAAGAGLLTDVLPGEVLAAVAAPAPAAAPVAETTPTPAPTGRQSKYRYTRPSGEAFYARKITFGDRETTDVDLIRDGVRAGLSLFFVGSPGCGKTAAIEASLWDWEGTNGLETLVGTSSTEASDFVGSMVPQPDGTFKWRDGPQTRAMELGKGLYIDEIGRIDPKVLTVLYSAMDGRDTLEIHENPERGTIKAKPGFFVIASTNPDAPGCIMDDALLSRFAPPIDYTTDFTVAVKYLGVPSEVAALARDMTKAVKASTAYWAPTMRDLLQWRDVEKVFGARAAWQGLVTAAPIEARPEVQQAIEGLTGMKIAGAWEV